MALLSFNENGIYCKQADVYIDPWKPVPRAIITHAHSDHARFGMQSYLAHHLAKPVMRARLGADINVESVAYGESVFMNGVRVSLHPAGHIWGSAQIRLEYQGEVAVVSGDYKLQADPTTIPAEIIPCHSFVTESTFGLPIYRFPQPEQVFADINDWWRANRAEDKNSVLFVYALGKAQRVLSGIDPEIGPIYTHGATDNVNKLYTKHGGLLPETTRIDSSIDRKDIKGALIIAPPSAEGTPWLRSFKPFKRGICSGWMQLRGTRRRRNVDKGFVLSDHADWPQLNEMVRGIGAENVYVTHGYKALYAQWLRTEFQLNAMEAETQFVGENGEDEGV